jgi:Carboxypeptidase regulatory-like domain
MRTITAASVPAVAAALLVLARTSLTALQVDATETAHRVEGRVISSYLSHAAGTIVTLSRLEGRTNGRRISVTDDAGRFAFDRVEAGRYEVAASAPRFTSKRLLEDAAQFAAGVAFTVDAGARVTNVDIPLQRSATISGRVIRSNGAAAPGIEVALARRQRGTLATIEGTQTVTAWDGRYTIADLPPGTYQLVATRVVAPVASSVGTSGPSVTPTEQAAFEINETRADEFVRTLYPGVPATQAGESVTLLEGIAADGIDIWLAPARRFTVSGRVFWPANVAVDHITLEYGAPGGRQADVWTVSDPGGLFTAAGVAPGPVVLLASADSEMGRLLGIGSTDARVADVQDVAISLVPPGSVQGRVDFAPELPSAARPGTVVLDPTALRVSPLFAKPSAAIGSDGSFEVVNALGEYEITVPGLPRGFRITNVTRHGSTLADNRIGVGSGETTTGIVVTVGRDARDR